MALTRLSTSSAAFCVCSALLTGFVQAQEPGSYDRAITVERLTGATLMEIGRELVWHFGVERFRLQVRGGRHEDLVRRLLGRPADVKRIEGRWKLDAKRNRLVLRDLQAGTVKNAGQVELEIWPAGMLRANLGDQQYNVDELEICGIWESVGKGPKVSWTFQFEPLITVGNSFVVQAEKALLPEEITTNLFGQSIECSKVEGEWKFKWSGGRLVLTGVAAGAHRRTQPIETAVKPVGVLTIELFGKKYRRSKWLRRSAFNPDTPFKKKDSAAK